MTTAADWINQTETDYLNAGARPEFNKLNGSIAATPATGSVTITLEFDPGSVKPGAWISVDLEDFLVWSVTGQDVTAERAMNGTTAATHADNSLVYVKPVSPKSSILRAINQSIAALASAGMYDMATVDLTFDSNTAGYNLTGITSVEDIYKVEAKVTGSTGDWREIRSYSFDRDQSTGDFASGFAIRLAGGEQGQTVRVTYKQAFVALTALATDVATTLLPVSAYDLPVIGAAARLVGPREVGRNYTGSQGDTRRAEEVPSRAIAASAADLWRLWDRRVGEEILNLSQLYPIKQLL